MEQMENPYNHAALALALMTCPFEACCSCCYNSVVEMACVVGTEIVVGDMVIVTSVGLNTCCCNLAADNLVVDMTVVVFDNFVVIDRDPVVVLDKTVVVVIGMSVVCYMNFVVTCIVVVSCMVVVVVAFVVNDMVVVFAAVVGKDFVVVVEKMIVVIVSLHFVAAVVV